MQKALPPIQVSGASPAPARAKNGQADGGAQFKQALHREVEQRKAPAPARQNGPAKEQHADKAGAPKKTGAEPAKAGKEKAVADEVAPDNSAAQAAAAVAVAQNPVLDMMALVASFNQPPSGVPLAPAAAPEADPLLAATVAPVADDPLAAAADTIVMNRLATAGAALQPGAVAPEAQPAEFDAVMAQLDGARPAPATGARPAAVEAAAPGQQAAVSSRPAEAVQTKALPDPAQFAQVRARDAEPAPKELPLAAPVSAPVQQASLGLANAAHGVGAGDKIAARVGTPGWDNQVAQKIVWMVAGKEQSASLTLNPPDMGPMQVVLNVTNDHATVTFSAATPEVRQALEDALPKLREMMGESGIALGNASVNDGSAQQQQQARDDGAGRGVRGNVPGTVENTASGSAAEAEAKAAARPARTGELPGLVDTFA